MKFFVLLLKFVTAIVVIGFLIFVYAWRIEPRWVEYNYLPMPTQNLPNDLVDKKIVQISDIHIGETVEEEFIIKNFKKIKKLNPDIVVFTGDFISPVQINKAPYEQLNAVIQHAPKGKLVTIAILGNHDYGILAKNAGRADSVASILKENGITVLRNEAIRVHGLNIIGIDDMWGTNFYPLNVTQNINTKLANLVLVHNPEVSELNIWNGYTGWILSGHTHGGQVRFPFQKATRLPVLNGDLDEGLKLFPDGRKLYINKGLGHSIRLRFNVRPEITVFTLQKESVDN